MQDIEKFYNETHKEGGYVNFWDCPPAYRKALEHSMAFAFWKVHRAVDEFNKALTKEVQKLLNKKKNANKSK